MAGLQIPIVLLPPRADATGDFYFEIQEIGGGVGSSKKLLKSQLATAILSALFPLDHSSLSDLGADDHPQYLNETRGDLRYTPIEHLTDPDPHPQYETSAEAQAKVDAKMAAHVAAADPHPQYQTNTEVDTQIDLKIATFNALPDPFPQYETSAEAQAKVDAKMAAHVAAADPHPQYASNAELEAEVASAVGPIAQTQVADYIASEGEALIDAAVAEQVGPAIDAGIAAHVAETNPHTQYVLSSILSSVETVGSVAGIVTLDLSLTRNFIVNVTENASLVVTNTPIGVTEIDVDFVQDIVGSWEITLPAEFKNLGGSDTQINSAANSVTVMVAKTKDSVIWRYAMQESQ